MKYIVPIFIVFIFINEIYAQKRIAMQQPKELGLVRWYRNYDDAINVAKQANKPLFILFQEVPGCATCQNYGNDVLSNPLIVDAIENEFVPLAIFNNIKGHDRDILKKFNEPTWNNPVIRIVNSEGQDLLKRHAGNYTKRGLVNYMLSALSIGYYGQPEYMKLLNQELSASFNKTEGEVVYSMYCFWSGEAQLGQLDGILKTTPGFMNGKEVVRVVYDKSKLDQKVIDDHAENASCNLEIRKSNFRIDKDPQYYLKKSPYRFLALSNIQKTKINTALYSKSDPSKYLSPSQKEMLSLVSNNSLNFVVYYEQGIDEAWWSMLERLELQNNIH